MTEAEWLACGDPAEMLAATSSVRTERKLRLLLTHSARCVWRRLTLPVLREAVEIAERYAEGEVSAEVLAEAKRRATYIALRSAAPEELQWFRDGVRENEGAFQFLVLAATSNPHGMSHIERTNSWRGAVRAAREQMPGLFRELFGPLPFRAPTFSPSWRTNTAVLLAQQMYDSRDFSALPILADALQDVGCDSAEILDHCRGPGPHVRGCWVVDLVLGKE
jgi:hypothetical protein